MEFVRAIEPILIIDAVKDVRSYLSDILNSLGFEQIIESECFESAKLVLKDKQPNVIFLDVEIPDSDSTKILKFINNNYPNSFVIMCSSHNSFECVQSTWEEGAKDFIAKPFNTNKVDTVLKRIELIT
jgi:two-component system, chemotaxis family, chemotaxis protein CheY